MSESHQDSHAHASHAHESHYHGHGEHGHEEHADHGHGEHGHDEHGHAGGVGDYNNQPPGPSTLPTIPAWGLAAMAAVLALLMSTIVYTSLSLGSTSGAAHGESREKPVEKTEH
jgi:hypothetical protein